MGRNADAILVFRRCLKSFDKVLNVSPSTQTRAIYNNLLARKIPNMEKVESGPKKIQSVTNL